MLEYFTSNSGGMQMGKVLRLLTEQQQMFPSKTLTECLHTSAEHGGISPLMADVVIENAGLKPQTKIGQLKGYELEKIVEQMCQAWHTELQQRLGGFIEPLSH